MIDYKQAWGSFLIFLIVIFGIGYLISHTHNTSQKQEGVEVMSPIIVCSDDSADNSKIFYHKISFEGHTYIVFDIGGDRAGVTHDENCRCRKKK